MMDSTKKNESYIICATARKCGGGNLYNNHEEQDREYKWTYFRLCGKIIIDRTNFKKIRKNL